MLWQVPLGNTKMRAENNTWEHYQDNKVETIIGDVHASADDGLRERRRGRRPVRSWC